MRAATVLPLLFMIPSTVFAGLEVKGWTAASDAFVVEHLVSGTDGAPGQVVAEVSQPGRAAQEFVLETRSEDGEAKADAKGRAAYDAYLKAHPLAPATPGRSLRAGKVTLSASVGKAALTWDEKARAYAARGDTVCDDPAQPAACRPDTLTYTGWATAGANRKPMITVDTQAVGRWTPYPSPDGAHVAWVFIGRSELGPTLTEDFDQVDVVGDGSFAVEVLAPKSFPDTALARLKSTLAGAGFVPVRTGPAKKARATSVVYAAKGAEAKAKELAAAVPGGATVEPLTWKSDCDVVVAVGDSAAK